MLRRFARSGLSKWRIEKRPGRFPVRGAACLSRSLSSTQSRGNTSNKLFSPCCWVKKSLARSFLNTFVPINPSDRAVSFRHVQPGRFVISSPRRRPIGPGQAQRIEPRCFCPDAACPVCKPKSNRAYSTDRATCRRDLLSPGSCLCHPRT